MASGSQPKMNSRDSYRIFSCVCVCVCVCVGGGGKRGRRQEIGTGAREVVEWLSLKTQDRFLS